MGKRFAIVIGVAAAGVMALGAQTASAGVHKYDTTLTITHEGGPTGPCPTGVPRERCVDWHGLVKSDRDRNPEYHRANAVRKCMEGRRVILFKQRPGADRRLGADLSEVGSPHRNGALWDLNARRGDRVYAKVRPKVRDRYVCRADRSPTHDHAIIGY